MESDGTDKEYERAKVVFEQDGQHFRALNDMFWRIPALAMTLTGGLWFGATKVGTDDNSIRPGLFAIAACSDLKRKRANETAFPLEI